MAELERIGAGAAGAARPAAEPGQELSAAAWRFASAT